MSELKVSVSGIRGIWGDSLTLDVLFDYTKAFGEFIKSAGGSKVLIGRDSRPTGGLVSIFCASILNAMGIEVIDCGIVPTPTVLFGVRSLNLDGGIVVTASHNPVEWNALKFVKRGGLFTSQSDIDKIIALKKSSLKHAEYDKTGAYANDDKISDLHIRRVIEHIDANAIKSRKFRVVLDPVNSAGSLITQWLLTKLTCETLVVNGEMDGNFARAPEPTPENLSHLKEYIRKFKADIGFAQDPDADRLVVLDENGNALSEELTLALALESVLSVKKGDIVVNMSTSRVIDDIADKYGVKVYRSKVGEANVVGDMEKYSALIGGEGNGGVIYPSINYARDSLVGIGLILELIARRQKPLSEIVSEIPVYISRKEKITFSGDLDKAYNKLRGEFKDTELNDIDGLRFDWNENDTPVWIHIRPSNTEPVVRIIGEAKDKDILAKAFERAKRVLSA
jgi:phosphomannomutase